MESYRTPERAAAWLQLVSYARNQNALQQLAGATLEDFTPDRQGAQALFEEARLAGREWLDDAQAQALLRAYGIATVVTVRVRDEAKALVAAGQIGYPVALKIRSPQFIHKSDVGGVALGLASAEELQLAAEEMRAQLARLQPQGFIVQAVVQRPGAHELIVGIASDAVFGPVLLLGEGGTAVELRKNHAVALPPLNSALACELIDMSRLAPLLRPAAGRRKGAAGHAAEGVANGLRAALVGRT
jgi:acetyltransferase